MDNITTKSKDKLIGINANEYPFTAKKIDKAIPIITIIDNKHIVIGATFLFI